VILRIMKPHLSLNNLGLCGELPVEREKKSSTATSGMHGVSRRKIYRGLKVNLKQEMDG
jgi:hypothetical protein